MTSHPLADALAPTGTLRGSINLGNPVLAQGPPEDPAGVTIAIAREIADRLGVPLGLACFTAARDSYQAMADGHADLCFLAVDPAREASVAFSRPYVVIEGVFVVAHDSPITSTLQVDAPDQRIGVKQGSAYDLFLSRELSQAEVVRGGEGVDTFVEAELEVGAGIRQPVEEFVAMHAGAYRVLPQAFMQIRQAVGIPKDRPAAAAEFVDELVGELITSGFIAQELARSGQDPLLVAQGNRQDSAGRAPESGDTVSA